jgi:hypothetical protein
MWRIEFTSADFLPRLPETCQSNPGVYGFELAWWLTQTLAENGIITSYPLGEDWGWLLEYIAVSGAAFTIGCASLAEAGEGYYQQPIQWSIFVQSHTSLIQRLKGISREIEVEQLGHAIVAALTSKGIAVRQIS